MVMVLIFGGCDPGLNGGFAVVSGNRICYKLAMPTFITTTKEGGVKTEIARGAVLSFLSAIPPHTYVAIEKQEAFRGQNITSTCTQCRGYGILLMALTAAQMDIIEVSPDVWQSHFGIAPITQREGKTTKQQALEIAQMIYPDTDFRKSGRSRKAHDGMVDASLIAKYCQDAFGREENGEEK